MSLYSTAFPLTPYDAMTAGVIPSDVYGIAINWFVNRAPLFSRLNKLPVGSQDFLITNDKFRPRSANLNAAFSDTSNTAATFADATIFDVGDVIQVDNELMLVTAITNSTTLAVTRGYASSTAATHTNATTAYLITNTRTGAETEAAAMSRIPTTVTQSCQTVMHAYRVGGSLQSTDNYVSPMGTPLDRDRMLAMQHVADDVESACYYGTRLSYGSSSGARAMMAGLANLIVTNKVTSPTNSSAYKPSDFVKDAIAKCFSNGGSPNVALVSASDFMEGLTIWGQALVRLDAGATTLGVSIDAFAAPFLDDLTIIPAPLLRSGTAIVLTASEVKMRVKRPLFDKPRGSRGDATEGDMIWEGAIELDNEAHHAFVSGIGAFSAS